MLTVVLDNDNARLANAAVSVLGAPSPDPMVADVLVVGQAGVGRWLEQRLSRQTGVSANLRIELPGRFVWDSVGKLVKGTAARPLFNAEVVRWAVIDAMKSLPPDDDFNTVKTRWDQATPVEQMVLATELGELFDRYLAYRRDWLDRWASGRRIALSPDLNARAQSSLSSHERWQQWLWQQVLERIDGYGRTHPFDVLRKYIQNRSLPQAAQSEAVQPSLFDDDGQVSAESVRNPEIDEHSTPRLGRIVLFGLLDMPVEQLQMFALLSELTDIVWFAQDPARNFWEDLVSPVHAAKNAAQSPLAAWLYENEPAVLGEWGRQQRDLLTQIRQLESSGKATVIDEAMRERPGPGTGCALHTLQQAIFDLSDAPWHRYLQGKTPGSLNDASLQVHGCHSLMRQVEAAHDALLTAFAQIPDLRADQVAVFCPDIEAAQPLVRAVFDGTGLVALPAQVSGRSARAEPQVRAFDLFLSLVQGPAHISAVLAWFDTELARAVCQLDDSHLAQLQRLLQDAGIFRDDVAQSDLPKHGWQAGFDRLILSGFTGDDLVHPIAGTLGAGHIDSSAQRLIGLVAAMLTEIESFRAHRRQTVAQWASHLLAWCDRWLISRDIAAEGLYRVRDALVQLTGTTEPLVESVAQQAVPFGMIVAALRSQLQASSAAARPGGSITVAPLGSLRHVPFRVCVLLEMNHGNWPGAQLASEYDLTRVIPRFGDRSVAQQARGTFLDVVLDTADRLIITYCARDDRANQVSPPARVVVELTDYVSAQCISAGWPIESAQCALLHLHPLQPFSPRRFQTNVPPSFATPWYRAAVKMRESDLTRLPVPPAATDSDVIDFSIPGAVSVNELTRSLLGAARQVMQSVAGVRIARTESVPEDIEPFDIADINRFERTDLVNDVVYRYRQGMTRNEITAWLQAMAKMPAGAIGSQTAASVLDEANTLLSLDERFLAGLGGANLLDWDSHAVRIAASVPDVGDTLITGRLASTYRLNDGEIIQLLPPASDTHVRNVVLLWYQHLLLIHSGLDEHDKLHTVQLLEKCPTYAKTNNPKRLELSGVPLQLGATQMVTEAVHLYHHLNSEPVALFPNTATRWLRRSEKIIPNPGVPFWRDVMSAYYGDGTLRIGEANKPWPNALWRDSPIPLEQALRDSLQVYGPMWFAALGVPNRALTATANG